jgi:inosine-uridine nucleoside N-ribohydrolase
MVNPTSIILDVDTGIDDALAIGMAVARADIDLIAVTTLAGNIDVENATENSRRVLGFLGANSIPVHRGASRWYARTRMLPITTARTVWATPICRRSPRRSDQIGVRPQSFAMPCSGRAS